MPTTSLPLSIRVLARIISPLFLAAGFVSVAHADTVSDFSADVARAVQDSSSHASSAEVRSQLATGEYKTTWDEFGVNVLVDGASPSPVVDAAIAHDITQTVAAEAQYAKTEAQQIQASKSTPEEVVSVEQAVGVDVPIGEAVSANPSLAANPDVSPTASADSSAPGSVTSADQTALASIVSGDAAQPDSAPAPADEDQGAAGNQAPSADQGGGASSADQGAAAPATDAAGASDPQQAPASPDASTSDQGASDQAAPAPADVNPSDATDPSASTANPGAASIGASVVTGFTHAFRFLHSKLPSFSGLFSH